MGIEYYLYKPKKKELLYLGKGVGLWDFIFKSKLDVWYIKDLFNEYFDLYSKIIYSEGIHESIIEYYGEKIEHINILELSKYIFNWCSNDKIQLIKEDDFYEMLMDIDRVKFHNKEFDKDYPITGNVYEFLSKEEI